MRIGPILFAVLSFVALCLFATSGCDPLRNAPNATPPATSYHLEDFALDSGSASQTVHGASITPAFFQAVKTAPMLGRRFLPDEYQSGRAAVTMISNRLWRRSFGADPAVIGKTIRLNGKSFTLVGIMPATFDAPVGVDLWIP